MEECPGGRGGDVVNQFVRAWTPDPDEAPIRYLLAETPVRIIKH